MLKETIASKEMLPVQMHQTFLSCMFFHRFIIQPILLQKPIYHCYFIITFVFCNNKITKSRVSSLKPAVLERETHISRTYPSPVAKKLMTDKVMDTIKGITNSGVIGTVLGIADLIPR